MKDNFSIIQSLCRAIVANQEELIRFQLERLAHDYDNKGKEKEARSIRSYIGRIGTVDSMTAINLTTSSVVIGEQLSKNVVIPTDKETAVPLLEIFFQEDLPSYGPLFNNKVMEAVKSLTLEWTHYEELIKSNAAPSRSCLVYGLPGTGKTHLAMWIAKMVKLPIVLARLDGLVSSFLGTSSRNIRTLFEFANRYKCILLLDEFDAIAKLRDDPQEIGEVKRVVNSLLQNLDERCKIGFTIGITNNEKLLDPAVWRRFDAQIEIPLPNEEVVRKLLIEYIYPLKITTAELTLLTWCLQGASGADIQKFTNWIKRMNVLNENKENIISLIRRYVILNTGRISHNVKEILNKENSEIINILLNSGLEIKKKDLAEILSISPSSLSKQISKSNNRKE
ncbi:AAA family ATPase [Prevotella intermedia]|uniref:AAA family ATPase n=1 Tax=Prevotella intermedia TaxID=28131 RepID=A0A2M8TJ62_PREIN|nr:ATP-binding protein [Prevotella intermedia]OWP31936.1 AAA family ATPase [Prevotella intermedia]PJI23966.1 AAA family ATPase [Prevotella intermedia]PJI26132.1 AAA family ATPase [Prevotella intermedia]